MPLPGPSEDQMQREERTDNDLGVLRKVKHDAM